MKTNALLIIFLFSTILPSCTNNENKTSIGSEDINVATVVIKIPEDISASRIDLSTFISEIDFIALETSKESTIGAINKVLSDEGSYIIHDKDNHAIFRFDEEGKFLNRIGVIGRGPQEYTDSWDVSLDRTNKEVSVLDLEGRKIIRYKYDGSFVGSKKMKFLYKQHEYTATGFVFNTRGSYNNATPEVDGFCLAFSDENHSITGQALPHIKDIKNSFTSENPLRKFSDRIYYYHPFKNEIFQILNDQAYSAFRFDFGKLGWDSSIDTDELNNQEIRELMNTHNYFYGSYVISEDYLFFLHYTDRNWPASYVYYSLSTGAMKYGSHFNDTESSHIGPLFHAPKWLKHDDSFISSLQPYQVIKLWKAMDEPRASFITEKEKSILQNAKESDNPILIVYRLNEF
jgi:hypothetical protein